MRLPTPTPFSLEQTVLSHGWYELSPFRWDSGRVALTRAEILPDGSRHLLRIRQVRARGNPIRVDLLGEPASPEQIEAVRSRVRKMLNLDLDLSGFMALCHREPRLRYVPQVGAGRFLSSGNLYEDVLKAICGTNIGWRQAVAAMNRLSVLGSPVNRSGDRAFPTAEQILAAGSRRLSEISRLGYRVPYLLEWASRVAERDPAWAAAESGELDPAGLKRFFLSVRGVGKSTCQYLLMMRGIADQVPIDSSVYLYCRERRFGGRTPTEKQIRRLYEEYGPWKAYVYWFEFLPWARKHWGLGGGRKRGG